MVSRFICDLHVAGLFRIRQPGGICPTTGGEVPWHLCPVMGKGCTRAAMRAGSDIGVISCVCNGLHCASQTMLRCVGIQGGKAVRCLSLRPCQNDRLGAIWKTEGDPCTVTTHHSFLSIISTDVACTGRIQHSLALQTAAPTWQHVGAARRQQRCNKSIVGSGQKKFIGGSVNEGEHTWEFCTTPSVRDESQAGAPADAVISGSSAVF